MYPKFPGEREKTAKYLSRAQVRQSTFGKGSQPLFWTRWRAARVFFVVYMYSTNVAAGRQHDLAGRELESHG